MRRIPALVIVLTFSLASVVSADAASPKPGAQCSKVGQSTVVSGKKFTCIKSGQKNIWSSGVAVSSQPTQTAEIVKAKCPPGENKKKIGFVVTGSIDSQINSPAWQAILSYSQSCGVTVKYFQLPDTADPNIEAVNGSQALSGIYNQVFFVGSLYQSVVEAKKAESGLNTEVYFIPSAIKTRSDFLAFLNEKIAGAVLSPTPSPVASVTLTKFKNCTEAKAAGVAPLTKAKSPELYELNSSLDRDKDGVACES